MLYCFGLFDWNYSQYLSEVHAQTGKRMFLHLFVSFFGGRPWTRQARYAFSAGPPNLYDRQTSKCHKSEKINQNDDRDSALTFLRCIFEKQHRYEFLNIFLN